jgi:hypothetical protein
MRWSKGWFVLVAVIAGVAATASVVLPHLLQGEVDRQVDRRLAGATRGAEMLVQLHARRWIDEATRAANDNPIEEALDQASRGSGNPETQHRNVTERLRSFQSGQNGWKAHQAIAVDARGRVMARVGADEDRWRDDLSASPVVADALRGWRLDDTWDAGKSLYRVAASPVISRDRYVGAVLVVVDLEPLVGRIHDELGVEAALVGRGAVVARSGSVHAIDDLPGLLPAVYQEHASELGDHGHTDALPLGAGNEMAVLALQGEAAAHQASLVLVGEHPGMASLTALLGRIKPAKLPLL